MPDPAGSRELGELPQLPGPLLPEPAERPTLRVEEAAHFLDIGRSAAYAAAREYERTGGARGLPCIRLGSRLLVPTAKLRELLGMAA